MRNYKFRVQSSYPLAQLPISCTIFKTNMRNYQFRIQPSYSHTQLQRPCKSSYPHAQLPISCTIFIPTCVITKIVYNLVTQVPNNRIRIYRQTHLLNYIVRVQFFIPTCAISNVVYNLHNHMRIYKFGEQ